MHTLNRLHLLSPKKNFVFRCFPRAFRTRAEVLTFRTVLRPDLAPLRPWAIDTDDPAYDQEKISQQWHDVYAWHQTVSANDLADETQKHFENGEVLKLGRALLLLRKTNVPEHVKLAVEVVKRYQRKFVEVDLGPEVGVFVARASVAAGVPEVAIRFLSEEWVRVWKHVNCYKPLLRYWADVAESYMHLTDEQLKEVVKNAEGGSTPKEGTSEKKHNFTRLEILEKNWEITLSLMKASGVFLDLEAYDLFIRYYAALGKMDLVRKYIDLSTKLFTETKVPTRKRYYYPPRLGLSAAMLHHAKENHPDEALAIYNSISEYRQVPKYPPIRKALFAIRLCEPSDVLGARELLTDLDQQIRKDFTKLHFGDMKKKVAIVKIFRGIEGGPNDVAGLEEELKAQGIEITEQD
eukprot:TRINITY_DN5824_c0_g1_i1.p1 TRINITY_DN5824_c0_g1~~TRINITY_DN5824_c0_g1_i1.p1  ORF type:complete len:407 (-),score=78.11 TRINITY_DN5824_c0_g1_i1:69-1289(-)